MKAQGIRRAAGILVAAGLAAGMLGVVEGTAHAAPAHRVTKGAHSAHLGGMHTLGKGDCILGCVPTGGMRVLGKGDGNTSTGAMRILGKGDGNTSTGGIRPLGRR